jgi:hypothetical protein
MDNMTRTMTENKKVFTFGKIDYDGSGRKNCEVTVEVYLKETDKGYVFSASGSIWNPRKTDIYSGGQNLNDIAKYIKAPLFKKIYTYWKKYHLNDMRPDCIHQRQENWSNVLLDETKPKTQDNMATWTLKKDNPKGLLSEPCKICGYKYGTTWLFEPIPTDDLNGIKALLEIN